jgi:hypothetical protein
MATANPRFRLRTPSIADSRHDLLWSTTLSPAEYMEAIAAAKAEGAREVVERIRTLGLVTFHRDTEGNLAIYADELQHILDEEVAR